MSGFDGDPVVREAKVYQLEQSGAFSLWFYFMWQNLPATLPEALQGVERTRHY
jgi:hypothetical protein